MIESFIYFNDVCAVVKPFNVQLTIVEDSEDAINEYP